MSLLIRPTLHEKKGKCRAVTFRNGSRQSLYPVSEDAFICFDRVSNFSGDPEKKLEGPHHSVCVDLTRNL